MFVCDSLIPGHLKGFGKMACPGETKFGLLYGPILGAETGDSGEGRNYRAPDKQSGADAVSVSDVD